MIGIEPIGLKVNLNPSVNYLTPGFNAATSKDPMTDTIHETKGLTGGPQLEYQMDTDCGMKGSFELSDRPAYGRYKTYGAAPRQFHIGQRKM